MKMIAAGGFKDITRIASSSAAVWQQICLTNTENISTLLSSYIASLQGIQQELNAKSGDDLYELFDSARIYRDSFINTASGPLKSSYAITIDIADEPGEIAAVATILALKNISIKNIGIVHNREYEGGVLRIEFYQEEAIERSTKILAKRATVCTTGSRTPVPGSSHYTKEITYKVISFSLSFRFCFLRRTIFSTQPHTSSPNAPPQVSSTTSAKHP